MSTKISTAANKKYNLEISEEKSFFEFTNAMAYWAEGKVGILILPDKIEYKDVLAHEAVHLASYLFKMRGIRHDLDNEEPYSYLVGWFVEEIDKFCNKK